MSPRLSKKEWKKREGARRAEETDFVAKVQHRHVEECTAVECRVLGTCRYGLPLAAEEKKA